MLEIKRIASAWCWLFKEKVLVPVVSKPDHNHYFVPVRKVLTLKGWMYKVTGTPVIVKSTLTGEDLAWLMDDKRSGDRYLKGTRNLLAQKILRFEDSVFDNAVNLKELINRETCRVVDKVIDSLPYAELVLTHLLEHLIEHKELTQLAGVTFVAQPTLRNPTQKSDCEPDEFTRYYFKHNQEAAKSFSDTESLKDPNYTDHEVRNQIARYFLKRLMAKQMGFTRHVEF